MFTGIVTDVGRIAATTGSFDLSVRIETRYDMSRVDIGASIACSGVCLTVVDKGDGWFQADVSAETLKVTSLGDWKVGTEINLERSLKVGDELGGHIVTGHVDCVGEIVRFDELGESVVMDIAVPHAMGAHVAKKGSVAIDGASLTVNDVADEGDVTRFSINLIPHTQAVTSFRNSKRGDRVNVEFDILARYVARLQDRG
jgi:riboflavin synthase